MLPFFDPDHLDLRTAVCRWTKQNLSSTSGNASEIEEEAKRLVQKLGRAGFLRYAVSKPYGGIRDKVQCRDLCIIREELAWASALADTMFALQALGSYPITLAGNEQQKIEYLPRVAEGSMIAAFALTEPQAGSDVAALESRASRRDKQYVLSGTKRFISNAGIADYYVVFAATSVRSEPKEISAFIVDADTPGLSVTEKTPVLSPHPVGMICFDNCVLPERALLGNEGEGLRIALGTLDVLRCTVGAAAVGLAGRALEEAVSYSRKRRQFKRALGEFQGIQFKLAEMATELEAARLLVYQAAWVHDSGDENSKQKSSMAKLFATEAAQRIVDDALQIHGGAGVVVGNAVERLYRDVRALRIYEGTSEIQKLIIARILLGKPEIEN